MPKSKFSSNITHIYSLEHTVKRQVSIENQPCTKCKYCRVWEKYQALWYPK